MRLVGESPTKPSTSTSTRRCIGMDMATSNREEKTCGRIWRSDGSVVSEKGTDAHIALKKGHFRQLMNDSVRCRPRCARRSPETAEQRTSDTKNWKRPSASAASLLMHITHGSGDRMKTSTGLSDDSFPRRPTFARSRMRRYAESNIS